jgi:hypothetical protein
LQHRQLAAELVALRPVRAGQHILPAAGLQMQVQQPQQCAADPQGDVGAGTQPLRRGGVEVQPGQVGVGGEGDRPADREADPLDDAVAGEM